MNKTKINFDKPIYVGISILVISKLIMYDIHYNVMKARYKNNIKLLYMDSDSYRYDIKTDDFYEDMKTMIDYFDTSDYPENNIYNMPRINKRVLGKMKDENDGKSMEEFVGLRSKMYAIKTKDEISKKSKRVEKCDFKNILTFEEHKDFLFNKKELHRTQNLIRSKKHGIHSIKIALSANDDKRFILGDGINTRALLHYKNSDIIFRNGVVKKDLFY